MVSFSFRASDRSVVLKVSLLFLTQIKTYSLLGDPPDAGHSVVPGDLLQPLLQLQVHVLDLAKESFPGVLVFEANTFGAKCRVKK